MITLKNIKVKNFLSIGNSFIEFDLETRNNTLIIGNSGDGKSTIIDAIAFGLYGVPYRKIKKTQIINSINKKNLVVEIKFNNYRVVRGITPAIFEIYKNDTLIEQSSDTRTYQEFLEKEILKMNFKTFIQTIVLGSAAFTPFMQLTTSHRREVIEDVLDIHIFSKMSALAKSVADYHKKDREDLDYKISVIKDSISSFQSVVEEERSFSDEEINSIKLSKEQVKEKFAAVFSELTNKNNSLAKLEEVNYSYSESEIRDAVQTYYGKFKVIDANIINKQEQMTFLNDNDSCSLCKQGITHEHKNTTKADLTASINDLKASSKSAQEKWKDLDVKHQALKEHLKKISSLKTEISITKNNMETLKNSIIEYTNRLKKIEEKNAIKSESGAQHKLKQLTEEIAVLNIDLERIQKKQKIAKHCIDILKDSGIKTVVISKYIPILNMLINKYLEQLDMFVLFELDSEFNETIKSRFRDKFSYFSFSEGEKKRIDFAILLAFRDITKLKNNMSSNILIIDELMDGLDSTNVDNVESILKSFEDTNMLIISHNDDIKNRELFTQVIEAKKVNNFTEYTTS